RKKSLGKDYQAVMDVINGKTSTTSKPSTSKPSTSKPSSSSSSRIDKLVKETLAGKHGNGASRKKSLGKDYQAVMDVINGKTSTTSKPSTSKPSTSGSSRIDKLVKETLAGKHGNGEARKKSLGKDYQAVMDVINGKKTTSKKTSTSSSDKKTIDRLVKETLAGKHGNGEARKKSLGKYYNAVQKEINKK